MTMDSAGRPDRSPFWQLVRDQTALTLTDHGLFRLAYLNRWRVGPDAWRAAQPYPWQFDWFARRGVRTVINLRGVRDAGGYRLEVAACRRLGLTLVDLPLRSRGAPLPADITRIDQMQQALTDPVLFHCKSGADRSGLMSALWLILRHDEPVAEAAQQLHWRFGHIRQARTGILDYFFARYLRDTADAPMPFRTWVATRYKPETLRAEFHADRAKGGWADILADRLMQRE